MSNTYIKSLLTPQDQERDRKVRAAIAEAPFSASYMSEVKRDWTHTMLCLARVRAAEADLQQDRDGSPYDFLRTSRALTDALVVYVDSLKRLPDWL